MKNPDLEQEPSYAEQLQAKISLWSGLVFRVAIALFAAYFLWRVRTILTTVIIALVLSSAAQALVAPLCRRRVRFVSPHTQRFIATIIVFCVLLVGISYGVAIFINPFQKEFAKLIRHLPAYQVAITQRMSDVQTWYKALPPDFKKFVDEQKGKAAVPNSTEWLTGVISATALWASHFIDVLLIPVLAFYFTLDGRKLRNQFLFLVPRHRLRATLAILSEGGAIMRAYIVSQFWLATIAGVIVGVGLKMMGMDYALVLGLLAGITRAIPIIGPLLGGIPIVLLSFVYGAQVGQPLLWVYVLGFFTAMHLVESKIIMPRLLGHALNLHAVVIIIALLIGGEFFGLMGMFLAAPIAALVRVLVMHYVIKSARPSANGQPTLSTVSGGTGSGGRILRLDRIVRTPATAAVKRTPPVA